MKKLESLKGFSENSIEDLSLFIGGASGTRTPAGSKVNPDGSEQKWCWDCADGDSWYGCPDGTEAPECDCSIAIAI